MRSQPPGAALPLVMLSPTRAAGTGPKPRQSSNTCRRRSSGSGKKSRGASELRGLGRPKPRRLRVAAEEGLEHLRVVPAGHGLLEEAEQGDAAVHVQELHVLQHR